MPATAQTSTEVEAAACAQCGWLSTTGINTLTG